MQDHIIRFHDLFLQSLTRRLPTRGGRVAILLSGGVDSATILAGLLELKYAPELFTFYLAPKPSEDWNVANSMAKAFSLQLHTAIIPRDQGVLISDIRRLLPLVKKRFKTHIQCSQPFIYLSKLVIKQGVSFAFFGMAADDLWGSSKNTQICLSKEGEEAARTKRRSDLFNENVSDISVVNVSKHYGLTLVDPYRDYDLSRYMLSLNMKTLHSPKSKGIAIQAFPQFWKTGQWYRRNKSLQVISGIREWHDTLLKTEINRTQSKSIVGIYNHL